MFGDKRKQRKRSVLLWILLNFIHDVSFTVHAKDVSFCFKSAAHYNVILSGGLEAGKYTPWEPGDVGHMTLDRCTEHCCKSPDTDVVFLLNSYCFCVKCHSVQLCSLKKITPPPGYNPVTVTIEKRISKLSTTTKPFSDTPRSFTRTQPTESSTQPTTERRTKEPEDVTTKSPETTSDDGLRRRTGEDNANLEVRNAHLPVLNGYSKTKDAPKSEAITSFSGISHSEPSPTTVNMDINITTPDITSTGPTTPRPTRVVKTEKKADGTGNDDISLQCPGTLKVIRVLAFGIAGNDKTVEDFDKHCQANLAQVDGTNVCIVSLRRVYKSNYPPFIKTLVTYTCSYSEFVS